MKLPGNKRKAAVAENELGNVDCARYLKSKAWITLRITVDRNRVTWAINGREVCKGNVDLEMFGDNLKSRGFQMRLIESDDSDQLEIDYVRVWKLANNEAASRNSQYPSKTPLSDKELLARARLACPEGTPLSNSGLLLAYASVAWTEEVLILEELSVTKEEYYALVRFATRKLMEHYGLPYKVPGWPDGIFFSLDYSDNAREKAAMAESLSVVFKKYQDDHQFFASFTPTERREAQKVFREPATLKAINKHPGVDDFVRELARYRKDGATDLNQRGPEVKRPLTEADVLKMERESQAQGGKRYSILDIMRTLKGVAGTSSSSTGPKSPVRDTSPKADSAYVTINGQIINKKTGKPVEEGTKLKIRRFNIAGAWFDYRPVVKKNGEFSQSRLERDTKCQIWLGDEMLWEGKSEKGTNLELLLVPKTIGK